MSRAVTLAGLLSLLLIGCDSGPPSEPDAAFMSLDAGRTSTDASVGMDASPAEDAGPALEDASASDAAMGPDSGMGSDAGAPDGGAMTDASVITDAGPIGSAAETCTEICDTLLACGFGDAPRRMECIVDCTTDLLDCSEMQRGEAAACRRAADACELTMVDGPPKLIECVMRISCVMG